MKRPDRTHDELEALRSLLIELNLTSIAREIPALLGQAETSAPSYSTFLRRLLDVEKASRTERKIQRRLRWSKLGPPVSLENFDFSIRPQLPPQVVKELLTCRFIDDRRNVILVGRPSLGKTTIARAIGHEACNRGMSVYAVPLAAMIEALHQARADGTYKKAFRRVTQADLLILEDAGLESLDHAATNELFRVVSYRHLLNSTLVTTNFPFRRWGEFLPSATQAVAIADRLIDRATILRFTGKPSRKPQEIHGAPLEDE
jgi:DNA replication protein DnaC